MALLCLGLFLGTLLIYAPVVHDEFLGYDDLMYVHAPMVERGLTTEGVRWAVGVGPGRFYFHPLAWMSHMLDVQLFDHNSAAHHFANVVYHAAAAVLLLVVLWRMTGAVWASAMTAALFAWHPLHVQSVAWVAERKDVLSGITFALALGAHTWYARRPRPARYGLLLLAAAAALASKPTLVTLPCVLLLLDYWPLRRRGAWTTLVVEKLPLLAMAAAASVASYKIQVMDAAVRPADAMPLPVRLGNVFVSYLRYLYKTLVPVRLSIFYPYQVWPVWQVAAAAAALAAVTLAVLWQARRRPYLLVGWLWFGGMLVPTIGLIQAGSQAMADRYTYLSLTGLFIAACWAAREWATTAVRRAAAAWAGGIVLAACTAGTVYQLSFWRDEFTLFTRALEVTGDDNWQAHGFVGRALAARGDEVAAERHYRAALRRNPGYVEGYVNYANLLLRRGDYDGSIGLYQQALTRNPALSSARNNLGIALARKGDLPAAEASFRAVVQADPGSADGETNLGGMLLREGRSGEAIPHLERALILQPDNAAARHFLAAAREAAATQPAPATVPRAQ